jgi:hypothetical protein
MDGRLRRYSIALSRLGATRAMSRSSRHDILLLLAVLGPGCYVDHVAGEHVGTEAAGTASSGSGATAAMSTSGSADGTLTGSATIATTTDESTTAPITCDAPTGHLVCDEGPDPFRAIGLGCPGNEFESTPLVAGTMISPDETAWRLTRELGNAFWSPREGSQLLVLSTGTLPLPDASGRMELPLGQTYAADGNNGNPDDGALPEPVTATPGSNAGAGDTPFSRCDGLGDCSDTLPAHLAAGGPPRDLIAFTFEVAVPADTHGWRVDLAWLSAEFPARVDAPANDAFVWWVASEAYVGNIATEDGAPMSVMSVSSLRPRLLEADFVGDAPALIDTGFGGTTAQPCDYPWAAWAACPRGAASGWLTLDGPANPGEVLGLTAVLFDQGDTELDTMVLVDDWRWDCAGCTPGQDCGLSTAP